VAEAVQALIPAIELIDTRYDSFTDYGGVALIADSGANGGLVLGEELTDWRRVDLPAHPVTLDVDGERKAEGTGKVVLGSPLEALFWLVGRRLERGAGLRAGEVISTGTCTGLNLMAPDQTAVADFGELGTVEVRFIK
jgi:2-keto-4-pentenoate hydratase